jgi:hypothetical protein
MSVGLYASEYGGPRSHPQISAHVRGLPRVRRPSAFPSDHQSRPRLRFRWRSLEHQLGWTFSIVLGRVDVAAGCRERRPVERPEPLQHVQRLCRRRLWTSSSGMKPIVADMQTIRGAVDAFNAIRVCGEGGDRWSPDREADFRPGARAFHLSGLRPVCCGLTLSALPPLHRPLAVSIAVRHEIRPCADRRGNSRIAAQVADP